MAERRFILRAAKPDDSGRLHAAYVRWNDKNVLPRPESELKAAAEKGLFFVVENESGEIVGASADFDLRADEYVESGATYVDPEVRGYRLQEMFFSLRVATVVVTQGPSVHFTTAIDPSNDPSRRTAERDGFVAMDPPIKEQIDPCGGCPKRASVQPPRPCCCDFYELPMDRKRAIAGRLLEQVVGGHAVLARKTGETLTLEVQCRVVNDSESRAALQDFVDGASW